MEPEAEDPWDWSIDQVVHSLCSPEGLMRNDLSGTRNNIDFTQLASVLRENDITGSVFLNEVDNSFLKDELGIKSAGQRAVLLRAQSSLRTASARYDNSKDKEDHNSTQSSVRRMQEQLADLSQWVRAAIHNRESPMLVTDSVERAVSIAQAAGPLTPATNDLAAITPTEGPSSRHNDLIPLPIRTSPSAVKESSKDLSFTDTAKTRKRVAPMLVKSVIENYPGSQCMAPMPVKRTKGSYLGTQSMTLDSIFYGNTVLGGEIDHSVATTTFEDEANNLDDKYPVQLEPGPVFSFVNKEPVEPGIVSFVNSRLKYYLGQEHRTFSHSIHIKPGLVPYPPKSELTEKSLQNPGARKRPDLVPYPNKSEFTEGCMTVLSGSRNGPKAVRMKSSGWRLQATAKYNLMPPLRIHNKTTDEVTKSSNREGDFLDHLEQKYRGQATGDILPVYGESDTESLDSDLWEEILKEGQEDEARSRFLTEHEKSVIIEEVKREMEETWKTTKVPRLENTAFRLWSRSRIKRTTAYDIASLEFEIERFELRMQKIERDIRRNQYSRPADLRKQCLSLEQTVFDTCTDMWKIGILNQSDAPPRSEQAAPKRKREAKPEDLGSDEEVLTDTDDESDLDNFVIRDNPSQNGPIEVAEVEPLGQNGSNAILENSEPVPVADTMDLDASLEDRSQVDLPVNPAGPNEVDKVGAENVEPELMETDETNLTPPPQMKAPSDVIDLTVSDIESDAGSVTDTLGEALQQMKEEEPVESIEAPQMPAKSTSPTSPATKITWREPPRAPAPRSPNPARGSHIVSLASDDESEGDEDDEDDEESTPGPEAEAKPKEDLVIELPKDSEVVPSSYVEIDALAKLDSKAIMQCGDCRKILAWMVTKQEDKRLMVAEIMKDQTSVVIQPGVWNGLVTLKSHGTKLRGFVESKSRALVSVAVWYIGWVACTVPDQSKGLKIKEIDIAMRAEAEFGEFYNTLEHILEILKERDTKGQKQKTSSWLPSSGKRQLLEHSGSENDGPSLHRKKRKYAVHESQEARSVRQNAAERQKDLENRKKLLRQNKKFSGMHSNNVLDSRPLINLAKKEGDDDITLSEHIGKRIFPYQVGGIQFMWTEIVNAQEMQGCLLAQPMGMGKTLQVIALLVTIAEAGKSSSLNIRHQIPARLREPRFLVLCPPTLVTNWFDELLQWIPEPFADNVEQIYRIDSNMSKDDRIHEIHNLWAETGGVLLMGYPLFRDMVLNKIVRTKFKGETKYLDDKQHAQMTNDLLKLPNIVVCDEAQELKSANSKISSAVSKIKTQSRIAMTGSPLSNNLEEYYRILSFVAPGYLGDPAEFRFRFVEPISASLYVDATNSEKRKGLKMLSILKSDIAPKVHRDEISVLKDRLPGKTEYVIRVPLTDLQEKCYRLYVGSILGTADNTTTSRARIWAWLAILRLLCSHPLCFERKLEHWDAVPSSQDVIPKNATANSDTVQLESETLESESQELVEKPEQLLSTTMMEEQIKILRSVKPLSDVVHSHKMKLLFEILDLAHAAKESTLVFSHNLATLNYVERLVKQNCSKRYIRFDGSTPMKLRQQMTKDFNNGKQDVCLISTKAGGTGLNMYGASRVVILDDTFNPSFEQQAIGRAYRIGQKSHVYVYRIVVGGTFEDAMQNQALFKVGLSSRVVDQKDTVRNAKKGLREWIFKPKALEQEDLKQYMGTDTKVLDKLIESHGDSTYIRGILEADSFFTEEKETLTEEEQRDVLQEKELLQLRRTDPEAHRVKLSRMQRDTLRTPAQAPPTSSTPQHVFPPASFTPHYGFGFAPPPASESTAHNSLNSLQVDNSTLPHGPRPVVLSSTSNALSGPQFQPHQTSIQAVEQDHRRSSGVRTDPNTSEFARGLDLAAMTTALGVQSTHANTDRDTPLLRPTTQQQEDSLNVPSSALMSVSGSAANFKRRYSMSPAGGSSPIQVAGQSERQFLESLPSSIRQSVKEDLQKYIGRRVDNLVERKLLFQAPTQAWQKRVVDSLIARAAHKSKKADDYVESVRIVQEKLHSDLRLLKILDCAGEDTPKSKRSLPLAGGLDGSEDRSPSPLAARGGEGSASNAPTPSGRRSRQASRLSHSSSMDISEPQGGKTFKGRDETRKSADVRATAASLPGIAHYTSLANILAREANRPWSKTGRRT